MTEERLLETARRLSTTLTPGDLDHTLGRITAAAVEVLPDVQDASITIVHDDGTLETAAPTAAVLLELDASQYELREGPCYDAAVDTVHVAAPNLAVDPRFPRYAEVAVAAGVRSQAGIRLFDTPTSQGALNLYSRRVGAFEDLRSVGGLFAHQSAMALEYAREVDNLETAIRTRKTIGQAIGIVMERYGLTDERAFAFLTRLSQHRNVKLRRVTQEMVDEAQARGGDRS